MPSSTPKLLLKHLSSPNSLLRGEYPEKLAQKLSEIFNTKAFVLNGGRSAIYVGLKTLGIGQGDEVIIQAYTCNAVPNPILWVGATPIYADIDPETLNISLEDLEKKISPHTKAIIVQHTFGNPGPIKSVLKIAERHNLSVIEDCAHSLGAKIDGRLLGTFGDLAILSFGREKVISSLSGGALLVNNVSLVEKVEAEIKPLKMLPIANVLKELNNYFSWRLIFRKIYPKNWGASFIHWLHQFDLINVVTSQKELDGKNPGWYPTLMPNVFAHIAYEELENVADYNQQRAAIADSYHNKVKEGNLSLLRPHDGVYLRVVGFHKQAKRIVEEGKRKKMAFGNWYDSVIYPESVHLSKFGYQSGSCPNAEKAASETLNLPNYMGITDEEIDKALAFISQFN